MIRGVTPLGGIDPAGLLRRTELFAGAHPRQLEEWIADMQILQLARGQKLFEQGDTADSLYIVLEGLLEVRVAQDREGTIFAGERGPGSVLGEIALLTGGKRNATVLAKEDSTLARLEASAARILLARCPEIKRRFLEIARDRLRMTQWLKIMRRYFGGIDEATLRLIEPHLDWVHVKRGEMLFRKGDSEDSFYFLVHGLLHILDADPNGAEGIIGAVYRGEIVGEMSLLTGEKRAASIRAVRDSDLVRLTRPAFLEISQQYPAVSLAMARVLVERLKCRGGAAKRQGAVSIALLPVNPKTPLREFSQRLHAALSDLEPTVLLSSRTVDMEFSGENIAQSDQGDPRALELTAWLEEREATTSFILYEADSEPSIWTHRCVDRADQVLLVAMAEDDPARSPSEAACLDGKHGAAVVKTDLVLLHQDGSTFPTGTLAWLQNRRLSGHQHVRWQNDADFARLARIVSRRSVGLVLGGGGAKGIAHIGVLRALEEAGIPIDMIGGSSMGGIIAGARALGWDHARMVGLIKEVFQQSLFKELTLPLISLIRSGKVDRLMKSVCGDVLIEDLWTSYFCTSSNLYTCKLKVHRRGPMWRAMRTTCSLPGIMVPIPYEGEVHIDGGVLNNLPCDVMKRDAGFVIAIDVDTYSAMSVGFQDFPSPWRILLDRIRRRTQASKIPGIFDIMLSAFRASNRVHVDEVKPEADLCIEPPVVGVALLDFARLDSLLQLGYDCAVKALAGLPEDSPLWKVCKGRVRPSSSWMNRNHSGVD